jgi:hypothetical protein
MLRELVDLKLSLVVLLVTALSWCAWQYCK